MKSTRRRPLLDYPHDSDAPGDAASRTSRRELLSRFGLAGLGVAAWPSIGSRPTDRRFEDGEIPGVYNVRTFGAKGDGVADDAAAFQQAVEEIAAAGKGVLYVPPGDFRMGSRIARDVERWRISIKGEGQGVSNIISDNSEGVFRFVHPDSQSQITIQNLSFFTSRRGGGTAVEIDAPEKGNRHNRNLVVHNVEMRGIERETGYFDFGIRSLNQWRPLFLNVIFAGPFGRGVPDEEIFAARCGFDADGSYAPSFQHCYAWSAKTGYRIRSPRTPAAPEDTAFYRSFAVECEVGMDIHTEPYEPQLEIDTCHINCRIVGVRLHHRKYFQITSNLFYNVDWDDKYPGYNDIELIGCFGGIITNNIFHQPANSNRKMIAISEKSYDLQIKDNLFNAAGTAVHLADPARGIVCADNQYHEKWVSARLAGAVDGVSYRSHGHRGALVPVATDQPIAAGATAPLAYQEAEYDTDGFQSDAGALTIPQGVGICRVRLSACLEWADAGSGSLQLEFTRNGEAAFPGNGRSIVVAESTPLIQNAATAVIPVKAGDVLTAQVRQTSRGAATIDSGWVALEVIDG